MIYNLTFNGKSNLEFDCYVKSINRTLKGSQIVEREQLPLRDGAFIFKKAYQNRRILVNFTLKECDYELRREKIRDIADWLNTDSWAILQFDDDPNIFYRAQVLQSIDTSITSAETDEFTVIFETQPFKKDIRNINVLLGDPFALGSTITLGSAYTKFTFLTNTTNNETIQFLGTVRENWEFVIELNPSGGVIDEISINGAILNNVSKRTKIDMLNKVVYEINIDGTITNRIADFNFNWFPASAPVASDFDVEVIVGTGTSSIDVTFAFEGSYY